jgi:hypothetical protein
VRAFALLIVVTTAVAVAGTRDWTGSARCGTCHPKELAAWQATPHATARLARPQSRCLACHGTGEAPAGSAIEPGVGCEACHGAGAAYAEDDIMRDRPLALQLGMTDVSTPKLRAAVCAGCHARAIRDTPFDPTASVH